MACKNSQDILENGMPTPASVSLSKMHCNVSFFVIPDGTRCIFASIPGKKKKKSLIFIAMFLFL